MGLAMAALLTVATARADQGAFSGVVEINTINVDVMATRHGNPVTNLRKSDFEVYEDGVRQDIANFAKVVDGSVYLNAAGHAVSDARDVRFRRHIALIFDMNFVEKPWLARALKATRQFVISRGGNDVDWSVVVIGSEPQVLVPFTADTKPVLAALDRIAEEPGFRLLHNFDESLIFDPLGTELMGRELRLRSEFKANKFQERLSDLANREFAMKNIEVYTSLARGLVDIFRNYASTPGKKACILVTGNMDLNRRPAPQYNHMAPNSTPFLRHGFDTFFATYLHIVADLWKEIERTANTSGFRIYAANALGLEQPLPYFTAENPGSETPNSTIRNARWEDLSRMLTDATGGTYFNANSVAPALETVDQELKTYYSLAFTAKHPRDNSYHKIEVKVRRPGIKLRYRKGLYNLSPETLLAEQMVSPASFPKVGGALPTMVRVKSHLNGPDVEVTATVATPVRDLTFLPKGDHSVCDLDIYMAVYNKRGNILNLKREQQTVEVPSDVLKSAGNSPFRYAMKFKLPKASYTVAMAVYDKVGGTSGLANAPVLAQ